MHEPGDRRAVVAEPLGPGIVIAEERDPDAVGVHGRELGLHADVGGRHLPKPVAHLEVRGAVPVIDKRVRAPPTHQVEHGLEEQVALAIHDAGRHAAGDGRVGFDSGCGADEEAPRPGSLEEATAIQEGRVHGALILDDGAMAQILCRRSSGRAMWVRCPEGFRVSAGENGG